MSSTCALKYGATCLLILIFLNANKFVPLIPLFILCVVQILRLRLRLLVGFVKNFLARGCLISAYIPMNPVVKNTNFPALNAAS